MSDMPVREKLARAAYPGWFGVSGQVLANYPGQEKHYQERAFAKIDAILAELESAGYVIAKDEEQ